MNDTIDKLLRQAEIKKIQIQTEIMFRKNMALFSARFPSIFQAFINHKVKSKVLAVDEEGNINLVSKDVKRYVYSSSPSEQSKKQVDRFARHGTVRKFKIPESEVYNPDHIYIPSINKMIRELHNHPVERENHCPNYLVNLILSGVGLGYQIPMLINRFDIQNIFIYENCKDTFHACLHVIDWQPILDYFKNENRSITFCLGVEPRKALGQIEIAIRQLGLHMHIFSFIYQHSQRKEELDFIKIYQNEIRSFIGGIGYFDDEQLGLAHAYHNLQSDHAVFVVKEYQIREERLIVVANGPSLDQHLDYLRENADKAIVMSCGSALGSLYRAGITPDFHVEMERDYAMTDFVKYDTPKSYRKNIILLCLHTVAPETLDQFGKACYALKVHDAGGKLVKDYFDPAEIIELPFCNPTVSNCAVAFAVYLGFNNMHLIGTDFGIPESGQHHSRNSLHYQMEKVVNENEEFVYDYKSSNKLETEGNFGGLVKTHQILDTSRVAIERLLDFTLKKVKNFKCYNSSNGAKIRNTIPISLSSIDPLPEIDKEKAINSICNAHFYYYNDNASLKKRTNKILDKFYKVRNRIKISTHVNDDKELIFELHRIFTLISDQYDITTNQLLRGSLSCFFASIVENTLYASDKNAFKNNLLLGIKHYNQFIDDIFDKAHKDPFKVDDFPMELLQKLREKEVKK